MKKLTLFLALFLVAAIVYADDVNVDVTHPLQSNDCIDCFIFNNK